MSLVSDVSIFLSFDPDNDQDLHDRLVQQSSRPHSGFAISARSESGVVRDRSPERLRRSICAVDEVVVICGQHTNASASVREELQIAQQEEKPYLLLWGRRECMCTKPAGAKPSDSMYTWINEFLLERMTATLRLSRPPKPPKASRPA